MAIYVALAIVLTGVGATTTELQVDSDFPGGSAHVESIDQELRLIRLTPTAHPGRGWACWWYFKVNGIQQGETLTVDVGPAPWATPDQAMYSLDGKAWHHTAPGKRDGKRIIYRQKIDQSQAWFAWGPPFVPADASRLVEWAAGVSEHATAFVLCTTRNGRPTPALRISPAKQTDNQRPHVWIQARQHAWESGSSWVAEGFVRWVLSDEPSAVSLRNLTDITVTPIMDVDNVAIGAGGKNQSPQDHNRDWSDIPHWRAVAAAQKSLKELDADGRLQLFIDLHNPGAGNRQPYFYVPPEELLGGVRSRNLKSFLSSVQAEMTEPLKFQGRTIASGRKYDPKAWQAISKNWVAVNMRDHVVPVTLETPWNTPFSTAEGYQQVGCELGRAIERHLRTIQVATE